MVILVPQSWAVAVWCVETAYRLGGGGVGLWIEELHSVETKSTRERHGALMGVP